MSSILQSTRNTRILPTGELRYVRSDFPENLSDEEIQWLLDHNITTIVDLRSKEELVRKPCGLKGQDGFRYIHLPVTGGGDTPKSLEHLHIVYRQMVDEKMEQIIDTIMNADSNVMYFCTAGKDRTGVVSAIILKRLGFSDDVIIDDYMESGDNLMDMLTAYVRVHPEVDLEIIVPHRENMERLLEQLQSKKIAFFCIPAHGHTNPMLPVAAELVKRGNAVRFYSFDEFAEKIKASGAEFISCDSFLPELTKQEEAGLKKVSTTEMTIQDIRITIGMNDFLEQEFHSFQPDVVYTDSVCFWGKLNAWKHHVPMVVSTSTFAFNQMSSRYMKNSPKEMLDMILGLPRISRELKKLKAYGYHVKGVLSLVQSDNDTDSVVYTSRKFQPCAESFSDHYAFVGPSIFSKALPEKEKERPLIYISMGTVINDCPDFYRKCMDALKGLNINVVISCGNAVDCEALGTVPGNTQVCAYVDQLAVLAKADVFITHCGMNSVSESLYMATPMVLYPQTGEQRAVARRTTEIGAGTMLADDSSAGIFAAVQEILNNKTYREAAAECSADFRSCSGAAGAAAFIEGAPH